MKVSVLFRRGQFTSLMHIICICAFFLSLSQSQSRGPALDSS